MTRLKMVLTFFICLLCFAPGNVKAQLGITASVTQFEVISINSLDFTQGPNWFQLTLESSLPGAAQIVLVITLFKDNDKLAEAKTQSFTLNPGQTVIQGSEFGTTINLVSSEIFEPGEEITKAILGIGTLPTGTYRFLILIQASEHEAETEVIINVSNPTSSLELIAPGRSAQDSDPGEWQTFSTNIITFVWFTNALNVTLQVVEARDLANLESNFENDPVIQVNILGQNSTFTALSGTSTDPNVEIDKYVGLTEGKFLWRILANVQTTNGLAQSISPMNGFQIIGIQDLVGGTSNERAMALLERLLGAERVQELFGPGGPLHGASIGDIRLDGQLTTWEALNSLINQDGGKVVENVVQP